MNQEQVFELQKELKHRDAEVINLRAQLRREQDARADLRVELDRVRAELDATKASLQSSRIDRESFKAERDEARADLVKAMQTIEAGASVGERLSREEAVEIARAAARAKPQSYYAEPFDPHEWVIDAVMAAAVGQLEQPGEIDEADRG